MSNIDRNDFDAIFDQFLQFLANPITLFSPMRKLTSKQQKLINKTWIRSGVLKPIKTKQKMYLSYFVNGNSEPKQLYKNMLTNQLKSNLLPKNSIIKINYKLPKTTHLKFGVLLSLYSLLPNQILVFHKN